jgi:hypothetical protein
VPSLAPSALEVSQADDPVQMTVMAYHVTIERTTECPTAVVEASTTWRAFRTLWPRLLDGVWAFLRFTPGLRAGGHNVMLSRNGLAEGEVAAEVGVQVTKDPQTGRFDVAVYWQLA